MAPLGVGMLDDWKDLKKCAPVSLDRYGAAGYLREVFDTEVWADSSVGRASRLHREGRRFEPGSAHHFFHIVGW